VDLISGPMVSVLLLLAVKAINGTVLKRGIIGADGVEPMSIMALFISLVRGLCACVLEPSGPNRDPDGNGRHISLFP
jgi:hypothetical protein